MAGRRFTLAGLLLSITLIGLILAFAVPLWRYAQRGAAMADRVTAIAMSADGSTAAALTGDGTLRVWNLARGRHQTTLTTGGGLGKQLALSHDGKLAALPSLSLSEIREEVEIWNVASRTRMLSLPAFRSGQLIFSPAQNSIVVENVLALMLYSVDGGTGRELGVAKAGPAAFSPDGRTIAVGEPDGVYFYDAATLAKRSELLETDSFPISLAFSPDGHSLAVLEETLGKRQIEMWGLATRESRQAPVESAGHYIADSIAYLPGDPAIAVPEDYGLSIVDATTLQPLSRDKTFAQLAAGLRGPNFIVANGGTVDLYDVATLQKVKRLLDANPKPSPVLPLVGLCVWLAVFFNRRMRNQSGPSRSFCFRAGEQTAPR